jgi:hypothetical protein
LSQLDAVQTRDRETNRGVEEKKFQLRRSRFFVFSRVSLEKIVHIDRGICDAAEKLGVPFTVVVFGSRSLVNDPLLSRACRPVSFLRANKIPEQSLVLQCEV